MASRAQNKALGGITPLGVFTITAGTPLQIISALNLIDKVGFTFSARQIGFSVAAASTGEVYVNYGNFIGLDANATVLIIQPGQAQSLPIGAVVTESVIDVTRWWLDCAATKTATVSVYASDASS